MQTAAVKHDRRLHLSLPILIVGLGLFGCCLLYESDLIFSVEISLALGTFSAAWGMIFARHSRYSFLLRLMIVLYAMPFMHCFVYLFPDNLTADRIWGLMVNPYQMDLEIAARMTMVGAIGMCAMVLGISLVPLPSELPLRSNPPLPEGRLGNGGFVLMGIVALIFSWLSAPADTIFEVVHGLSETVLGTINFNGPWMVSHVFMLLLFIDAWREERAGFRRFKFLLCWIGLFIIVIILQFMRGDRECIGMILALLCLYAGDVRSSVDAVEKTTLVFRRFTHVAVWILLVFAGAQVVGVIRSLVESESLGTAVHFAIEDSDTFSSGTWSSVLLGPLSVVGDDHSGLLERRWGQTYIDYTLSIPPGVITQFLGIERPVESGHGPSHDIRFGQGGTHAMVVPFMNFGVFGVLAVLILYGYVLARLERRFQKDRSTRYVFLYSTFLLVAPFWFWYGEMYVVRSLMSFILVWIIYRALPKSESQAVNHSLAILHGERPSKAVAPARPT